MFVKHMINEDIFKEGFILNPLFNETFSREKITPFISTYMNIWLGLNSYKYLIVTDRENEVERGTIKSVSMLKKLTKQYFDDDVRSFIKRNISQKYDSLNSVECAYFNSIMKKIDKMNDKKVKQMMLDLFGESYV